MKRVKIITLLALFIGVVTLAHSTCRASATDNAFVIPPAEALSIPVYLNDSSGIHGGFFAVNGSVNFAFVDPDGIVLYGSDCTNNVTISYSASKAGTYSLRFSNPALTQAILVELKYSVKSWHTIEWAFTMEVPAPSPWGALVLTIMIIVMKLLTDFWKHLNDVKTIVMEPVIEYNEPKLPLRTE